MALRQSRNGPLALLAITRSHSAGSSSTSGPLRCSTAPATTKTSGPVQLAHQLSVHGSRRIEALRQLPDGAIELEDALALTVVVALELGGALLESFDEWFVGFAASEVGGGTEVVTESLAQYAVLLGKAAGSLALASSTRRLCSVTSERAGKRHARSLPAWRWRSRRVAMRPARSASA